MYRCTIASVRSTWIVTFFALILVWVHNLWSATIVERTWIRGRSSFLKFGLFFTLWVRIVRLMSRLGSRSQRWDQIGGRPAIVRDNSVSSLCRVGLLMVHVGIVLSRLIGLFVVRFYIRKLNLVRRNQSWWRAFDRRVRLNSHERSFFVSAAIVSAILRNVALIVVVFRNHLIVLIDRHVVTCSRISSHLTFLGI